MQIRIRYDNQFQAVEVSESECESMIRTDYEERLAAAADPSSVQRRSVQDIVDELFNKPECNNYKQEHRYTLSLDARVYEGEDYIDPTVDIQGDCDRETLIDGLYAAIRELEPQQRDLVVRVFFNNERPADIAKELGVTKQAIDNRLNRIFAVLGKKMKKFLI